MTPKPQAAGERLTYRAVVIYYLIFAVAVLVLGLRKPTFNWDLIGYVAAAKSFETSDPREIHSFTYAQVAAAVPPAVFRILASDPFFDRHYRLTMFQDPLAFAEQLPFYQIRVAYVLVLVALSALGLNLVFATYLVSSVSAALGLLLMFFMCRRRLSGPLLYLLPPLSIVLGILDVARQSSPDGLAFLGFMICVYLLIEKRRAAFAALVAQIAVRTDTILFSLPALAYASVVNAERFLPITATGLACVAVYAFINWYFHDSGWMAKFVFAFVDRGTHPLTTVPKLSVREYLAGVQRGVGLAIENKAFVFWLVLVALACSFICTGGRTRSIVRQLRSEPSVALIVLSVVYVTAHFIVFPLPFERYFLAPYLIVLMASLWIVSERG